MLRFFEKISNEVKELGEEILTFYEQLNVCHKHDNYYGTYTTIVTFRDIQITHKTDKGKREILFAGFCKLTNKEVEYIHDCITKAYLKQITFKNNDNSN